MRASANTVCLLCRHRLATAAPRQVLPWPHPTAACTYSTASAPAAAAPNSRHDGHGSKPDAAPIRPQGVFTEDRFPTAGVTSHGNARNRGRFSPRTKPLGDDDMGALFHQIVDGQSAASDHAPNLDMSLVSDIAQLETMVDSSVPITRSYHFLKTELYPRVQQEGVHVPRIFLTVVSKCMSKLITIKKRNMWDPQLPSVADILRVCADIGEMPVQLWNELVGMLVEKLCEPNRSRQDYESIEAYENHLAMRDAMMEDLIESWKVLSLPKSMVVDPAAEENEVIDGFWLPRLEKAGTTKFFGTYNFKAALCGLFPQYQFTKALKAQVSSLAIATYALLLDPDRSKPRCKQNAARFMAMVAYVLEKVRVRNKTLRDNIIHTSPLTSNYILAQWPRIVATLEQDPIYRDMSNFSPAPPPSARRADNEWAVSLTKRLSQYYLLRNRGEVDRLWHEFIGNAKDPTAERAAQLQQHPDVFNSFINTYMALNLSDKAIAVWNTLPSFGLRPTLKTWNMMLDGCRKARNLNGLNAAWKKLVASGVRLDTQVWTTRVAALIDCGDTKAALAALQELVTEWNTASSTGRDAVQPTMEPVNAALAGLVRQENLKGAENLIHWARKHGVSPDVVTFNTLLRPLIRNRRDHEVKVLFRTMKALEIQADAATFTIVLDGTLAHIPEDDTAKQLQVVSEVFEKMRASGLEANLHTYGKMIYLLLCSGDRATKVVDAVISHLRAHGHNLSPHIYTMLIEHYFNCRPPKLNRVEELLQWRRLLDYDDMDRVLYERVIKGYASVGEPATAFEIYCKLNDTGMKVELDTQTSLLEALVVQGRLENAKALVNRTVKWFREQHGVEWREPRHAKFWAHSFWHMAERYGVLDGLPEGDEDVPDNGDAETSSGSEHA